MGDLTGLDCCFTSLSARSCHLVCLHVGSTSDRGDTTKSRTPWLDGQRFPEKARPALSRKDSVNTSRDIMKKVPFALEGPRLMKTGSHYGGAPIYTHDKSKRFLWLRFRDFFVAHSVDHSFSMDQVTGLFNNIQNVRDVRGPFV